MTSILSEGSVKALAGLANDTYAAGLRAGYDQGWTEGFNAALEAAKAVTQGVSGEDAFSTAWAKRRSAPAVPGNTAGV